MCRRHVIQVQEARGTDLGRRIKKCRMHYIILNNGILKSKSTIFPRSEGYITQHTP